MFSRIGNSSMMTFEEFVILYLNYKPQLKIKCEELHVAFNELIQNDQFVNAYGENKILTRESFVHMMKNKGQITIISKYFDLLKIRFYHKLGEKINPRELEIILNTLLKTTKDISSGSGENADLIHLALPFVRIPT